MGDKSVTLPIELLYKYHNDYFVETGSFEGGAIQAAIDAGFSDIRSIEVDPGYFDHCSNRFQHDLRVTLFLGDSLELLPKMIEDITDPITFWLDAHYGNSPTNGSDPTPLISELQLIGQHPVKSHTIMIDDIRLFGKSGWEKITKFGVIDALLKINNKYEIVFENSLGYENDIIVAYIVEGEDD